MINSLLENLSCNIFDWVQKILIELIKVIDLVYSLPYTEAVLMEAQRISSIAPFTVPHFAMADTKLQGHSIPKVTFLYYSTSIDYL